MGNVERKEGFLRFCSMVLLVLTTCLVAFDSQTKRLVYTVVKKATFRELNALVVLVWVHSGAACYNLLQVLRCYFLPAYREGKSNSYKSLAWGTYLVDQAVVYTVFAVNSAAVQASALAVTGEKSLQWMKVCNRFTRFCVQIGGSLLVGYLAVLLMVVVSSISAYRLFRLYSPAQFLVLKGK